MGRAELGGLVLMFYSCLCSVASWSTSVGRRRNSYRSLTLKVSVLCVDLFRLRETFSPCGPQKILQLVFLFVVMLEENVVRLNISESQKFQVVFLLMVPGPLLVVVVVAAAMVNKTKGTTASLAAMTTAAAGRREVIVPAFLVTRATKLNSTKSEQNAIVLTIKCTFRC